MNVLLNITLHFTTLAFSMVPFCLSTHFASWNYQAINFLGKLAAFQALAKYL
jgi:hypothetical protein